MRARALLLISLMASGCAGEAAEASPDVVPTAAGRVEQPPACLGISPDPICEDPRAALTTGEATNVLGEALTPCSADPMTGFYRDGYCRTGPEDRGVHVVCAKVDDAFLAFTAARGNDLSTPRPAYGFPGLAPGDRWCLCAARWREAHEAGVTVPVELEATHRAAARHVDLDVLRQAASPALAAGSDRAPARDPRASPAAASPAAPAR